MPGDSQLTLVEEVDWEVGDRIMITSTNYNMYEAEFFNITSISVQSGKSVLTLDASF